MNCPKCNFVAFCRKGFHFDHEYLCSKCDHIWEPIGENEVTPKWKKVYAKATARGVKKISGLRFGDRLKVTECGRDVVCNGYITFIDYKTGDVQLQMYNSCLPLSGIDDWQIVQIDLTSATQGE